MRVGMGRATRVDMGINMAKIYEAGILMIVMDDNVAMVPVAVIEVIEILIRMVNIIKNCILVIAMAAVPVIAVGEIAVTIAVIGMIRI